jgi:thioglycine synthase
MFNKSLSRLKSRHKFVEKNGTVSPRTEPVENTLAKVIPLCERIGVTRISNITYMDKLYIPNYTVVLPGTEDSIWVYSGKGTTMAHAQVSALMESIERYSSLGSTCSKHIIQGTYSQLKKSYGNILHPDEVIEPVELTYSYKNSIVDFLEGYDLTTNKEVLVPIQLALSRYSPNYPAVSVFQYSHTNGLASGNVLEEAICHALCEVIERDAASIADLCSSSIPYTIIEKTVNSLTEDRNYPSIQVINEKFVDDPGIFPEVDISEITSEFRPIRFLFNRFVDSGIPVLIKEITQKDIGIPTFVASSAQWISNNYGLFAKGYGAHPDARIALLRAITEMSQTRAGNIQGARDDLRKITYSENDELYKRRWQFMSTTTFSSKMANRKMFSEIESFERDTILDDIKLISNHLKKAGLKRIYIVDLTNPTIGIPVVRAIVPGLETFEVAKLFMNNKLIMGRRAKRDFLRSIHS